MNWLEVKYIGLISGRLEKFKRKSNTVFSCRCHYCGDSKTHKNKTRGYIYLNEGSFLYHCHNCGITKSLPLFIRDLDHHLYNEFMVETLATKKSMKDTLKEEEKFQVKLRFNVDRALKGLKKISQLPETNPMRLYVESRKIPSKFHYRLYECPAFYSHINKIIPEKFDQSSLKYDEPRLLIPFFDEDGKVHTLQGRSLNPKSQAKYLTIVLNEEKPKIYGLDKWKKHKETFVFEGPLDCMLSELNAIATAGGDLVSVLKDQDPRRFIIVYDNEKRSVETKKKLEKAIDLGFRVVIWPENLEGKDINDFLKNGLTVEQIQSIIQNNVYSGMEGKLRLVTWSKR